MMRPGSLNVSDSAAVTSSTGATRPGSLNVSVNAAADPAVSDTACITSSIGATRPRSPDTTDDTSSIGAATPRSPVNGERRPPCPRAAASDHRPARLPPDGRIAERRPTPPCVTSSSGATSPGSLNVSVNGEAAPAASGTARRHYVIDRRDDARIAQRGRHRRGHVIQRRHQPGIAQRVRQRRSRARRVRERRHYVIDRRDDARIAERARHGRRRVIHRRNGAQVTQGVRQCRCGDVCRGDRCRVADWVWDRRDVRCVTRGRDDRVGGRRRRQVRRRYVGSCPRLGPPREPESQRVRGRRRNAGRVRDRDFQPRNIRRLGRRRLRRGCRDGRGGSARRRWLRRRCHGRVRGRWLGRRWLRRRSGGSGHRCSGRAATDGSGAGGSGADGSGAAATGGSGAGGSGAAASGAAGRGTVGGFAAAAVVAREPGLPGPTARPPPLHSAGLLLCRPRHSRPRRHP